MLKKIADGVLVHESKFLQSQSVVVEGKAGVLLIDPGITRDELANLAGDLHEMGQPVVAGFSTHPHWDHLLWDAKFGEAPRYGTPRNEAEINEFLSHPDWKEQVAPMLPPEMADEIPLDLMGLIKALPDSTTHFPWDGPRVRIMEHQAHAKGHAAVLIEASGALVAGDMLSDILIPFLDLEAENPINDYLSALEMFEGVVEDVKVVVTGHGSICDAADLRARIKLDRAYVEALRDGGGADDPRLTGGPNKDWLPDVHKWQAQQIALKK